MKKIGIITTGGDCSGLNSVIYRLIIGAKRRGWATFGILDGTDGLTVSGAPNFVKLDWQTLPPESVRLAGSWLRNGMPHSMNFESAKKSGKHAQFATKMKKSLAEMKLDALVLIGGNGSLSLALDNRQIYGDIQLIGIPKTVDMDIPLTDSTIGFDTAVQQLTAFCDQLMLTARSHHRWFVVQAMGRDTGHLALHAGVAIHADAILIPEIKFKTDKLVSHIKNVQKEQGRDYGIILASEGISLRGHSGKPADMISRELTKAGITNRAAFPEHTQRAGDTVAGDRILAARMADCALDAIENHETFMMVAKDGNDIKTVPIADMFAAGTIEADPKVPDMFVSNSYVGDDQPLLSVAHKSGIYIGEVK